MNPKYDTKLKVKDMQGQNIFLVQTSAEVEEFNKTYDEDYNFYFIKIKNGNAEELFGCCSLFKKSTLWKVADL